MTEETEPVFTDPEKWRAELYRQNLSSIIKLYEDNKTEDDVGVFLLDLLDPVAKHLANALTEDTNIDSHSLSLILHLDKFMKCIGFLSAQKPNGFQIGNLLYREETEVPICVVAANGATFFAVQNMK